MAEVGGDEKRIETLLKWCSKLGIRDSIQSLQPQSGNGEVCIGHSLTISHFPNEGGRGLAAVRRLKKGELILIVPNNALITSNTLIANDNKLRVGLDGYPSLSPSQRLAVCLLYEMGKGKSSFWYIYMMNLPRSYDILATFSELEKQAFQVGDAIWATEKAVTKAEFEWKEAFDLMEELGLKPQLLSFRAWLWATATISSRTLHIPWDEAGCLCPVGDLFNYAAPGEEVNGFQNIESCMVEEAQDADIYDTHSIRLTDGGFDEGLDAYCFYARRDYKKGEQVLLSYGTYTNLELVQHYGFLLNKNPNEKVFIPLEPEIYSSNSWPKESLYLHQNGKPSFALMSALRLWATPAKQRRSIGHLVYSGHQLSVENDILVFKWLSQICHVILGKLATGIEEDMLILSVINKVQGNNNNNSADIRRQLAYLGGEALGFLNTVNLSKRNDDCERISRSLDKWRLAVEWRIQYKTTLLDCISYSNQIVAT